MYSSSHHGNYILFIPYSASQNLLLVNDSDNTYVTPIKGFFD